MELWFAQILFFKDKQKFQPYLQQSKAFPGDWPTTTNVDGNLLCGGEKWREKIEFHLHTGGYKMWSVK